MFLLGMFVEISYFVFILPKGDSGKFMWKFSCQRLSTCCILTKTMGGM